LGGGKEGGDDLWRGSGDVSALLKSVMGEAAAGGELRERECERL